MLYLRYVPAFHYFEDDEAPAPEPRGGFFWDGRADSLVDARAPAAVQPRRDERRRRRGCVAAKIARGPYAKEFRAALGPRSNPEAVLRGVGVALEAYLKSDEMTPATLEVRRLRARPGDADGAGEAGPRGVQGPARAAPARAATAWPRRRPTPSGVDVHRLRLRRDRAAAQPRAAGQPQRPASFDLGLCERKDAETPSDDEQVVRELPHALAAQRRRPRRASCTTASTRACATSWCSTRPRAVAPDRFYPPGQTFDDVPPKYRDNVNIYAADLQPPGRGRRRRSPTRTSTRSSRFWGR